MKDKIKQVLYQLFYQLRSVAVAAFDSSIKLYREQKTPPYKHYKIEKSGPAITTIISAKLIKNYGIGKIMKIGTIIGIISIIIFFIYLITSALPLFFVFAIGMTISLIFLVFYTNYIGSQCEKCGANFAYEEIYDQDVISITTPSGIEKDVTRTYQCRNCGDTKIVKSKTFSSFPRTTLNDLLIIQYNK